MRQRLVDRISELNHRLYLTEVYSPTHISVTKDALNRIVDEFCQEFETEDPTITDLEEYVNARITISLADDKEFEFLRRFEE